MPRLTELKPVSIAAQLRKRWSEIEKLMADGVPQQHIIASLRDEGIVISHQTFRDYLCRERKRRKTQAVESNHTPRLPILPPGTGGAKPSHGIAGQAISKEEIQAAMPHLSRRELRKAHAEQYADPARNHPLLRKWKEHDS